MPECPVNDFSKGKYVRFGRYPQTAAGTDRAPVEWLVLDRVGNHALLISRYGLDTKPYNAEDTDVTWEICTLRRWLNHDFLNTAFSAAEQAAILTAAVDNSASQGCGVWNTCGGRNTRDKLFLLSCTEARKYFAADSARTCRATEYATDRGACVRSGSSWWWLRSPGCYQYCAAFADTDGSVGYTYVSNALRAVRPALWMDPADGRRETVGQ